MDERAGATRVNLFDKTRLAGAEYAERNGGPWIGLRAFKEFCKPGVDPSFGALAALGALRCATRLGKEREQDIEEIASYWSTLGGGPHFPAIQEFCKTLARLRQKESALRLAQAEVERNETARALYLLARCLELTGDTDAAFIVFGRAVARADQEKGAADVATAARVWRIERLLGDRSTAQRAVTEAAAADPTGAPDRDKLVIARGRLLAPSRFVRASGLSLLEELARDPTTSLGRLSIRLAAEHADALGDALTSLEADRVAATLRHVPDEAARDNALARLTAAQSIASSRGDTQAEAIARAGELSPEIFPLVCRARAALTGGGQGEYALHPSASAEGPASPSIRVASLGLSAFVALAKGRAREGAEALAEAAELLASGAAAAVAPPVWTAALVALEGTDPLARAAGVRVCEALLGASCAPPPRGFSALAVALSRAGRSDLAARAARDAVAGREPEARVLLGSILRDEGWAHAARGQRELSIAALHEAKEHLVAASGAKGR